MASSRRRTCGGCVKDGSIQSEELKQAVREAASEAAVQTVQDMAASTVPIHALGELSTSVAPHEGAMVMVPRPVLEEAADALQRAKKVAEHAAFILKSGGEGFHDQQFVLEPERCSRARSLPLLMD